MPPATAAPDTRARSLSLEDIVLRSHQRLTVIEGLVDQRREIAGDDHETLETLVHTIEWCVTAIQKDLTLTERWPAKILNYRTEQDAGAR
jgi:hypothetical protein